MNVQEVAAARLARIVRLESQKEHWSTSDLRAIIEHQLDAPLAFELTAVRGISSGTVEHLQSTSEPPIGCFYDLIAHPNPPVTLLELAKQFGKHISNSIAGDLPIEIGTTIYYAAIAKAHQIGEGISALPANDLAAGLKWHADQPWMTPDLRELMLTQAHRIG